MSLPDPSPARKPRRLGLWLPFVALGLLVALWSGAWVWARGQAASRMDAAVAALGQAGYHLAWKDRQIGGYPFRLDVTLTEFSGREPSGWGLDAPRLEAEAYMHALGNWVIAAPAGLSFVRPIGGPVAVKGDLLHASLTHLAARPPSFSFEGVKLTFTPQPGAQPFALTTADRVEFHLRAGPDDEGGVFARLDGGKARLSGLFARVAGDKPIGIVWNSTLSKMSAFQGRDWPSAVRHWADAGGRMTVRDAGITAGDAVLGVRTGTLGVASDGRLSGSLPVTLRQAPRALDAMGAEGVVDQGAAQSATAVVQARQAGGDTAQATLDFQAGRTTLGPVALGAAPKVYDAR
ncbi:DUF2125 domain-containing protein [Phenylobacterium sp.]|jgi:hypothetical protein|uniref:DUF2125 domain-containing protein n=1 Tax=Phenylobacterium sp. TaxID=1871053 RepID=UPI002E34C287|nr:DUF2125 domain-containing protein [Phenylobacterium sp.]HEX3366886.1 DUF2125 domain-containing protein [Phenylobacterium sp.]